eukprot:1099544-Pleurochrysis_carterae.AAC.1
MHMYDRGAPAHAATRFRGRRRCFRHSSTSTKQPTQPQERQAVLLSWLGPQLQPQPLSKAHADAQPPRAGGRPC